MFMKKEFQLQILISLEEINLSRLKQNDSFHLFDKSRDFPVKHAIYGVLSLTDATSDSMTVLT